MPQHIVSFSGGKDSTAMLLMMLEKQMPIDRIICIDTTKEFPQMYEHIKKVQLLCPVEIEITKIDFDYWFSKHVKARGKNKGQVGYGWPDFRNRWCTALKRDLSNRILSTVADPLEYQGISFDEQQRLTKNFNTPKHRTRSFRYPLVEWEITGAYALNYCYGRGLDWGGLYKKLERVSCWCCPLARVKEFRVLYRDFPELWLELQEMDLESHRRFTPYYTLQRLSDKFEKEKNDGEHKEGT